MNFKTFSRNAPMYVCVRICVSGLSHKIVFLHEKALFLTVMRA